MQLLLEQEGLLEPHQAAQEQVAQMMVGMVEIPFLAQLFLLAVVAVEREMLVLD